MHRALYDRAEVLHELAGTGILQCTGDRDFDHRVAIGSDAGFIRKRLFNLREPLADMKTVEIGFFHCSISTGTALRIPAQEDPREPLEKIRAAPVPQR